MTTQQEVAEAFVRGDDNPKRASNFRMVESDEHGSVVYIVGYDHMVYAKREPIGQITYYNGWNSWNLPYGLPPWRRSTVRNQCRVVRDAVVGTDWRDSYIQDEGLRRDITTLDETPDVDNFDDLALST